MASFRERIKHAFNTFLAEEDHPNNSFPSNAGPASSYRPDRPRVRSSNERTIISSIYTRLAIDVAAVKIEHVRTDTDTGLYVETIQSGLNNCFTVEANVDQGARHFRMDIPLTLFTEGCIGIVPVDTTLDPASAGNWDVKTMRVGSIVTWWPQSVRVRAYNEINGRIQDIDLPKRQVAIVENPFYSVMNEPNSTLQRLLRKLSMLDHVDEISSQGKLDIIIQLPYVTKSETRKTQALKRTEEIADQLQGSTYGIAYTDGTEKITQLNRSVTNNLLEQIKYLKAELFNELGLTEEIMNGTANDVTMLNYYNRTIQPIMDAITEAVARTFLTKTARSQGQTIMYFQTPFKLLPITELANVVDVLSRNQIVTPNEIRPILGLKPSNQPQANALINSNMPLNTQVTGDIPPTADASTSDASTPAATDNTQNQSVPTDQAAIDEANLNKQMAELGL